MHNQDQIEYWNGPAGQKWVAHNSMMEKLLHNVGIRVIDTVKPAAGERAMDIGCGCGNQTLDLARRIGPGGEVIGVDISAPMLSLATDLHRNAADRDQMADVYYVEADASEHDFVDNHFDVLFSRFGVMFFDEPIGAFKNLRSALRPGGRMAFVCWQAAPLNPFMSVPMQAAMTVLPAPEPMPPGAPGPFAFADAGYLGSILSSAGFDQINIDSLNMPLHFGAGHSFDAACDELIEMGPISRLLKDADESLRAPTADAIRNALKSHYDDQKGLVFDGRFWIAQAVNPD